VSRFTPKPAVRKGQKARLALTGPSGSGKTWTALEAATVLAEGGPILVSDTERGSASLYADHFTFDVVEWTPPFDPRHLADLISEQADSYAVIVADSLTHFWEAEGGTRDIVDAAAARARGNSFAGWKEGTPAQNDMVAAILNAPCHVIATMRSKTEYILEQDSRGKQVPRKVGMAPIQRAGIEYEFTVTAEMDYEHTLLVDKTRCHALAGKMFKQGHTVEMAETLRDWLGTAEPMATADEVAALMAQMDAIEDEAKRKSTKGEFVREFGMPGQLTAAAAERASAWLNADDPAEEKA
jgi:hypothetical protein